ncbi:MAG: hypothetical protein HY545_00880 [Candidatus Doudnabacteria bacterium]|nr:hypothetical protein [Candidatus Doudnabacteria bacterium]
MALKALFAVVAVLVAPCVVSAQVKGPQVSSLFVEAFPISNSPNKTIMTADYNIKAVELDKLKVTVLGFLDLEPQGKRRFYFTNNDQIVKYGAVPIGVMFEEAVNRGGQFGRIGPIANLNDIIGARIVTKIFTKVLNVSWLKAAYGNITDEVKLYVVTKDLPVGIGWLNAEGFYRIRYGTRPNFGQPQINFRPRGLKRLKIVCELEQNGRHWDIYLGARIAWVRR